MGLGTDFRWLVNINHFALNKNFTYVNFKISGKSGCSGFTNRDLKIFFPNSFLARRIKDVTAKAFWEFNYIDA